MTMQNIKGLIDDIFWGLNLFEALGIVQMLRTGTMG